MPRAVFKTGWYKTFCPPRTFLSFICYSKGPRWDMEEAATSANADLTMKCMATFNVPVHSLRWLKGEGQNSWRSKPDLVQGTWFTGQQQLLSPNSSFLRPGLSRRTGEITLVFSLSNIPILLAAQINQLQCLLPANITGLRAELSELYSQLCHWQRLSGEQEKLFKEVFKASFEERKMWNIPIVC